MQETQQILITEDDENFPLSPLNKGDLVIPNFTNEKQAFTVIDVTSNSIHVEETNIFNRNQL